MLPAAVRGDLRSGEAAGSETRAERGEYSVNHHPSKKPVVHFQFNRRSTCPFHIHNPVRTITGTATNRTTGA